MSKRERITLRLDAEADSIEGCLFKYLKQDPAIVPREAILRALKAFYLLWALEGERGEDELRIIAKTLLEELQFRMLQTQQRFLKGELPSAISLPSTDSTIHQCKVAASPAGEPFLSPSETFAELIDSLNSQELDVIDEF